jgi:hypothetical protein
MLDCGLDDRKNRRLVLVAVLLLELREMSDNRREVRGH